jgi:hypothetical protein
MSGDEQCRLVGELVLTRKKLKEECALLTAKAAGFAERLKTFSAVLNGMRWWNDAHGSFMVQSERNHTSQEVVYPSWDEIATLLAEQQAANEQLAEVEAQLKPLGLQ